MARLPRITVPMYPHHIIQRGNNRQIVFFIDDDYRYYLNCLRLAKMKCQCRIYAYVFNDEPWSFVGRTLAGWGIGAVNAEHRAIEAALGRRVAGEFLGRPRKAPWARPENLL